MVSSFTYNEHWRKSPDVKVKRRNIKIGPQELGRHKPNLNIVTVGSIEADPNENLTAMGEFMASRFVNFVTDAREKGLTVAFDMPTGSSPKPFYEALKKMKADLSNVIFFGHEAEWPPAVGNSSLDYENQRKGILTDLGIKIQEITETGGQGNYVVMYQADIKPGSTDEEIRTTALDSAKKYDTILEDLLGREDVVSIGYYGVGVDGHGFGELQNFHMWPDIWQQTESTFITPIENYSLNKELLFLAGVFDSSKSATNDLLSKQQEYPHVRYLMGLGRKIMSKLDYSYHIFNSPSKYTALEHILGSIKSKGEGEKMLGRFQSFADMLRKKGVEIPDTSKAENCYQIVKLIQPLIGSGPENDDFSGLVRLIQEYFGLKTPVSMGILERANQGKSSTLIMPADISKGKEYEFLAK